MANQNTMSTSPFAALVQPALVQAAAQRAERLDLPRHRSTPWAARDSDEDDTLDADPGMATGSG